MSNPDNSLTKQEQRNRIEPVEKALYSQKHREELRKSVEHVIKSAVNDALDDLDNHSKDELTKVAWQSFVPTIGAYLQYANMKINRDEDIVTFSTMLSWNVRNRINLKTKHNTNYP